MPHVSVTPRQVTMNETQMYQNANVFELALDNGFAITESKGSFYMTIEGQKAASETPFKAKVDKGLAEEIMTAMKSGGRISKKEVAEDILAKITDGGKYTEGESILSKLLLAACDDRKKVMLNGKQLRITDPAEEVLQSGLKSFWGKLGAKAKEANREALNDGYEKVTQNKFI